MACEERKKKEGIKKHFNLLGLCRCVEGGERECICKFSSSPHHILCGVWCVCVVGWCVGCKS